MALRLGGVLERGGRKYGFYNWKMIYEHPDNKDFKDKRTNPNILFPGDRVLIPDKRKK